MTEDNKTILANLAITIAEKEEDIKRLTNRIQELTDQCNALNNELNDVYRVVREDYPEMKDESDDECLLFYDVLKSQLHEAREEVMRLSKITTEQDAKITDLRTQRDSDKWFSIVKVLNKWRKHKIKSGKVFKENMRNRVRHEYDDQIRDLTLKLNAAKRSSSQDRERFNELNANYRQLSSSFNQQLKEKQSHRFQMDGEWLEMTTQELIDFYVSCHPHEVTEGMGMYCMEIPACKTCAYKFPPTEEQPKKRKKKSDVEQLSRQ